MIKKKLLFSLFICLIFAWTNHVVFADDNSASSSASTDTSNQVQDLQSKINDLQSKISDLHGQEKTLSSQIDTMDNNIKVTEYRITLTKQQITNLEDDISAAGRRITLLEGSLNGLTKVLLNRIVATYEIGSNQPIQILMSSNNAQDFFKRANYLKIAQEHDKRIVYDTVQAKNDYANQKNLLEAKKQKIETLQTQLVAYSKDLDTQKTQKQKLLAETQGSEANYQRLISQAKSQLAGFSHFTSSHGGSSLLSNQTTCDSWGCYYNQRDSQWGAVALNNTQYSIASDGCLMTSMAMVYTHFGHGNVTPLTINSDPNNFASYYPAYLNKTIIADGTTSTRVSASIDSELSGGRPVIVGISYDNGPSPDHFVVLMSGSSGSYTMNDPYTPGGHAIPFTDHYSVGSIREIDKVTM